MDQNNAQDNKKKKKKKKKKKNDMLYAASAANAKNTNTGLTIISFCVALPFILFTGGCVGCLICTAVGIK